MNTKPVLLTHDMIRKDGMWRCMNCGEEAETISELNSETCKKQKQTNENILKVLK